MVYTNVESKDLSVSSVIVLTYLNIIVNFLGIMSGMVHTRVEVCRMDLEMSGLME